MYPGPAQIYRFVFMSSAISLSACGSGEKDEALGRLITDCQMSAHYAMADSSLTDEKKHVAIGGYVERCLKEGGLQPQADESCVETPQSAEDGKSFVKPLKKCWKYSKSAN
ncbi:MAG: hypothetical protein FD139_2084 [Methylocystaceae bacterium]|nr:MAG: hypothetical protein FD148_341 [Methylocystaceae bacterium]KAF0209897.1 MAG: hypothetical protein FD172_3039 [Methylocystaceae bacterium]TXT44653.1 MAG: hypothetical protein FD139_2084 [Methylocystaceae bacterium]